MMQRGSNIDHSGGGGLGPQLVGEKINVNRRIVSVIRQLGEGMVIYYILSILYCILSYIFFFAISWRMNHFQSYYDDYI